MKPASSVDINLLPQDPFYSSLSGRVLVWSLSAGRYLLIFTLTVVIISFASRFTLDRQRTDLNGEILQKMSLIESYGSLESDFRAAQNKLQTYSDLADQTNLSDVFAALSRVTPAEVVVDKLTVSPGSVSVSGTSPTQEAFNTLITNLQLSGNFEDINISKVEASSTSEGYSFQFSAAIPQQLKNTQSDTKPSS